MEQFPSYPVTPSDSSESAEDRFVIVARSLSVGGQAARTSRTAPMTWDRTQEILAQIAAGEPTELLLGPIHLVAESEPGRLLVCLLGGMFSGEETYDIRVVRVLYSVD